MFFIKKEVFANIGKSLLGLGLLFFGLNTMSGVLSADTGNPDLINAVKNFFNAVDFPPLLLLIGAIVTALIQSSSATSGIAIAMVSTGALNFNSAVYLVLGATIGTVIVTIIASLNGSIESKRTAWIVFFIRIVTAFMALAIVWPIESLANHAISNGLLWLFGNNLQITLALFLVIYNLIFIFVPFPFIKPLVNFF